MRIKTKGLQNQSFCPTFGLVVYESYLDFSSRNVLVLYHDASGNLSGAGELFNHAASFVRPILISRYKLQ